MNQLAPDLTNGGLAMLIEALDGDGIKFTRIVLGNGEQPEDPKKVTHVGNPIVEIGITDMEKHENFVLLTGNYDNSSLENGFYMNEIGIFAQNTAGNEVLYAYRYSAANVDYIPDKNSGRIVETQLGIIVSVGTTENVTAILTESAGYASKQEFDDHSNDINNPHQVTKQQIGLGNVENLNFNDNIVNFTEAEKAVNIETNETMSVTLGKIKRFITELLSHLKAKNPHGIDCKTISAAASSHKHSAADITSGALPVARGGTGAASAATAAKNILAAGAEGIGGNLQFAAFATGCRGISGTMANNDLWRVIGAAAPNDDGYLAIDTADNGTEPILVRQFTGVFGTQVRCLSLLDKNGNTTIPGELNAGTYKITTNEIRSRTGVHLLANPDAGGICHNNVYLGGTGVYCLNNGGGSLTYVPVYAQRFYTSSSRKVKKNITPMSENEARKLLQIEVVGFDYINGLENCYGVIAEDVDEIVHFPVAHDENGEASSVDYTGFVPYLIKMLQMQEERIRKLEEQIGGKEN